MSDSAGALLVIGQLHVLRAPFLSIRRFSGGAIMLAIFAMSIDRQNRFRNKYPNKLAPVIMKPLHSLTLTLLVSLLLVRLPAKAALVQGTDPRFGPDSLTIDTSTHLAWLDLTASVSLSYNQALADTMPGGIFSGYRFATTNEILGLFASAGIPGNGRYPTNNGSVQSLISLLGPTQVSGLLPEIEGITGSSYFIGSSPLQYLAHISYAYNPAENTYDYVVSDPDGGFGPGVSSPQTGNWLVMEVPEPSACSLTLGGSIGLAFVKRSRRGRRAGSRV